MVNEIIVQRQVNLIAMLQDEISIRVQDKKDPSMAMSALREAISLLKELMSLGSTEPVRVPARVNTESSQRADNRRQEEYERDVRSQYEREQSRKALPPTQYIYNDGFHGVTLPSQRLPHQEQRGSFVGASASTNVPEQYEPYAVEEKEYWDNE
jgi:hypothetical protein